MTVTRVVIVGASLAGLRAAEELRVQGHTGSITVIGDERLAPYDRPPLSKATLTGRAAASPAHLAHAAGLDIHWEFGVPATSLDRSAKQVILRDGRRVDYDKLVIATGRRARPWHDAAEAQLNGVLSLRTADDGARLRELLDRRPKRVAIIGAGFIGSEVASACRALGLPVSVIARGASPLDGALGGSVGTVATALYTRNGVDLRASTTVAALRGNADGQVNGVELDDGTVLSTDVVVIATGSLPNVGWLEGSGLDVDGGVAVDGFLRALDEDGVASSDIVAAGDVTRWAHPTYGDRLFAIEHWGNAVEQGRYAARTIVDASADRHPFVEVPRFWSTIFGTSIKSIGVPSLGEEVVVVQGSIADRRGVVIYGRQGRCVAAVSFDSPRELEFYEAMVEAGAPFPPVARVPDWGRAAPPMPVPARFPVRGTTRPHTSDGATSGALSGATEALGLLLHAH